MAKASTLERSPSARGPTQTKDLDAVTIRFAGDSGDGMQVAGSQFTATTALVGNDLSTFPDYPAEIRAPAGTLPGVSGFQIHFSSHEVLTAGDQPDVLVTMNPAGLKVNLSDMPTGSTLIVNSDAFSDANLKKAGYASNPLRDGSLSNYRVVEIPLTVQNQEALKDLGLAKRAADRSRNFYALGILYWLYNRPLEPTLTWIRARFAKNAEVVKANETALRAGYFFGETAELFDTTYRVPPAPIAPGTYRNISGNEATALGFITASQRSGLPLFYASYPITPASDILHELSRHRRFGVKTFQAEDEIAAIGAALGASFGGALAITGTSGPGVCLKSEGIGLGVMVELPVVIASIQRAGPSTGMPTKGEQADLLQALFGRNGESPVAVVAPATPAECFRYAVEACRIATKYMCPVFFLSDGNLANGAEPWRIPTAAELPSFEVRHRTDPEGFHPYLRDPATLARPWVRPGTPGMEHRIGGLEKQDRTGNISYDPANHETMVRLRAEKIERIARDIPPAEVHGAPAGRLLVVGWGSTHGAIQVAVDRLRQRKASVSCLTLRHLNPFPANLGDILRSFDRVLVPEMNLGQLSLLLRAKYLVDAIPFPKVQGRPFRIAEIAARIEELL